MHFLNNPVCFIGFGLLVCVCMRLDERGSCEYLFVGVCVLIVECITINLLSKF